MALVPPLLCTVCLLTSESAAAATETRTVFYQIYVRGFYDSNGDGIGDLQGVTEKLDYLEELGVGGIWLMPLFRAPTDHKYFSSDYDIVDPEYGTNADLANLVKAAHDRSMRVIIDFMVNHTSVKHKWFHASTRAFTQQAEGREQANPSPYLDYYHWMVEGDPRTKNGENTRLDGSFDESRLAHWKQAYSITGQPVGKYYSRFVDAPDLNYDNPLVRNEIKRIGKFWLTDIGVDGFRLDAARHIYDAENNQPVTNESRNAIWWSEFCEEMKRAKPDCLIIGEIWSRPKVMASYLQTGMDSVYDFSLAGTIRGSAKSETDKGVVATVLEMNQLCSKHNPEFVNSTFLENHDFPRLMTLLGDDESKTRLAAAILLTLPGRPFLYYGDELGLRCDKKLIWMGMPWSDNPKQKGQTMWMHSDKKHLEGIRPVSSQAKDGRSMLSHFKRLIHLRNSQSALHSGTLTQLPIAKDILSYQCQLADERVIAIHNLTSRSRQIDLPAEAAAKAGDVLYAADGASLTGAQCSMPAQSTLVVEVE